MNKCLFSIFACALVTLSGCSDDPAIPIDSSIPVISKLESSDQIQPSSGQVISHLEDGISFYLKVEDPEGVSEVELEIAGKYPFIADNEISDQFELLNYTRVLDKDYEDPFKHFPFGLSELKFDPYPISWGLGEYSVAEKPILSGPYDISIHAADINGNQTKSQEGASYQTTVFVERSYSPNVWFEGQSKFGPIFPGEELLLKGAIFKSDNVLSTPLKFVWARLQESDNLSDSPEGIKQLVLEERTWGESRRISKSGPALPSEVEFTFDQLFEENPILIPSQSSSMVLIIWAEDQAGNVTRKSIPLEVD